jgi:hypothetical protein
MPVYNFYLCDDALPVLERGPLKTEDVIGHSALQYILAESGLAWPEAVVKELLEKAAADSQWRLRAARSPEFFIKEFERSLDRPDVLVFDWDYPGVKDPEGYLLEFLSRTYCIIQIYSGADMKEQIQKVISADKFSGYQRRLFLSEKTEVTPDQLLKAVEKSYNENFSYRFGAQLRSTASKSLEEILVSLGRNSIDEVMALLHAAGTTEGDFKELFVEKLKNHLREDETLIKGAVEMGVTADVAQALVDLVADKLRNDLNSEEVRLMIAGRGIRDVDAKTKEAAAKLWSYRLYYKPSDNCVRRGDFIEREETKDRFIVVNADCDLNRLWSKNYGYVNLVPACEIGKESKKLAQRFKMAKITADNLDFKIPSIANTPSRLADGTLLLPFVPIENRFFDFLIFPKEIVSIPIEAPASAEGDVDKIRQSGLSYDSFPGFQRLCTLSEPFVTPFVVTLLSALQGQGVPDYPPVVRETIQARSRAALR